MKTQLYFVHGWACDSKIWHKWLPAIDRNIPYQIFDRGYLGSAQKNISLTKTTSKNVLITHSLGIHFLPPESFQAIDLLVLLSSFRYFHEDSLNDKLSAKRTNLMKQRLVKDPLGLLQDFYSKCGLHPLSIPRPSSINSQLLYDDLLLLDTDRTDLAQLEAIPAVLLLHGGRDQIVSVEHSRLMHQQLPNSRLLINNQAEHALPITNAQWCMQAIDDNKNELEKTMFCLTGTVPTLPYSSITANFNRRAKSYDQTARAQKLAADRLALRISRQIPDSSSGSILEVGCGTGLLSKHLVALFPKHRIHFLDPAEDMLTVCHRNIQNDSTSQFIHSTIEDYFINPRFSRTRHTLIASSFVLHWLFDLKLALNGLLEKLAPGGQLVFSIPAAGSFRQWQNICKQLNLPFTGNQLPGLEDIKSAVDNSEATIECEEYDCDIEFQNSLQFFQHMKMLGANTKTFIRADKLTVTDFRCLLKTWDDQSATVLGKGENKVICTYKILEGTITRR